MGDSLLLVQALLKSCRETTDQNQEGFYNRSFKPAGVWTGSTSNRHLTFYFLLQGGVFSLEAEQLSICKARGGVSRRTGYRDSTPILQVLVLQFQLLDLRAQLEDTTRGTVHYTAEET